MAQIAQQDNLFINVGTSFPANSSGLTAEVKAKLISCFKAGTILDVVLVAENPEASFKQLAQCVGAYYDDGEYEVTCVSAGGALDYAWAGE